MAIPIKGCLALTGLASISTSVTAPLVLSYGKEAGISELSSKEKIKQVSTFENIVKCESASGDSIDFGELTTQKVCWLVGDEEMKSNLGFADDQKYTQLFKRMGNNPNGTGSSEKDSWRSHCDKNKGMFSSHVDGGESLGLCDNEGIQNQGVMVQNKDKTTVEVCAGNCFEEKTTNQGKTLDSFKKIGNGKQFRFQRLS